MVQQTLLTSLVMGATGKNRLLSTREGKFLKHKLGRSRVSPSDISGKLRAANTVRLAEDRAVVLEATSDLGGLDGADEVEKTLPEGVSWGAYDAPKSA